MSKPRTFLTVRRVLAGILVLFAVAPLIFLWASAPSDPIYRGVRFSTHLLARFGTGRAADIARERSEARQFREVLAELGPRTAPVLRAWYLKDDSDLRERLLALLRKAGWGGQLLAIDHNEIAARAMREFPEFAVPWVPAVTEKILHGDERGSMRAAVMLAYLFNSVPAETKREMARACRDFPEELLRQCERSNRETYALSLLAHIYEWDPPPDRAAALERLRPLANKSRYLERAVAVLKESGAWNRETLAEKQ